MERRKMTLPALAGAVALAPAGAAMAGGDLEHVSLIPVKDNTLFSLGTTSNGAGDAVFSGQTGMQTRQRAVMAFDVAGNVPAGATIVSASLTLRLVQANGQSPPQTHTVHRLLADWGEGASVGGGGTGAPARPGDATWFNTFFPDRFWLDAGGDFIEAPSSSLVVDIVQTDYTFPSTDETVADAQGWLDAPDTNFGWLIAGNEIDLNTSRRFASRESSNSDWVPVLTIEYRVPPCPWDLDGDGTINVVDLLVLIASFGPCADPSDCPADFDGDGLVGVTDLLALLASLGICPGAPCPWDVNDDGVVDGRDLHAVLDNLGPCGDSDDCPWDVNDDGAVDTADVIHVALHFGSCE